MGESILQLRQIRKSFDNTEVLKGIDLEVAQGEFITLLGASGCGKTTTLRIIAGLELPDAGQVILEGQDITNREPNKRDVNTVFQNYALFPHMNVSDNIGYGLKIRKVPKAEIAERVEQALRLVQLEEYGKRMPDQLSGGQKQRIAIARAVINEPKVLLPSVVNGKIRKHRHSEAHCDGLPINAERLLRHIYELNAWLVT